MVLLDNIVKKIIHLLTQYQYVNLYHLHSRIWWKY